MSVYRLSGIDKELYKSVWDAANARNSEVMIPMDLIEMYHISDSIPNALMVRLLGVYSKAISESRYNYLYMPSKIKTKITKNRTTIKAARIIMEMCCNEADKISLCNSVEQASGIIVSEAMKRVRIYDRIIYVYKFFVDNYKYSIEHSSDPNDFMAIGPILYKRAVCEGFAYAFAYILNRIGIPCGIVSGISNLGKEDGPHAWNVVKLGEHYYHVDVTWDINRKDSKADIYDYFLLDDKIMKRNHRWNDGALPVCDDNTMDMYVTQGILLKNENELYRSIEEALQLKRKRVAFRCDEGRIGTVMNRAHMLNIVRSVAGNTGIKFCGVTYSYDEKTGTGYYLFDY